MTVMEGTLRVCKVVLSEGDKLGVRWRCDSVTGRLEAVVVDTDGLGHAAGITEGATLVSVGGVAVAHDASQEKVQDIFSAFSSAGGGEVHILSAKSLPRPISFTRRTPFASKKKPSLASLVSSNSFSISDEGGSYSNGSFSDQFSKCKRTRSCELFLSHLDSEETLCDDDETLAVSLGQGSDTFHASVSSEGDHDLAAGNSSTFCSSPEPENALIEKKVEEKSSPYHKSCPRITSCLKSSMIGMGSRTRRARSDAVKQMSWAPDVTTPTNSNMSQSFSGYRGVSWDTAGESC